MSKDKRSRMGPESDEYNRLKGKIVRIWPPGESGVWIGRLVWVDVYTLGVSMDPGDPSNVSIVYKNGIRVERYDGKDPAVIAAERDNHGVEMP